MATSETLHRHNPSSKTRRWLRGLALASVVSAFALIILGGVVRVTGSGLGCGGDWPLCDGRLLPAATAEDIIEWSHRWVAAAIDGPLIMATAAVAWLGFRRERWLTIPAAAAVIMLLLQGGLGGVTVLTELPGAIVAAHLALAQALLGCLILLLVAAFRRPAIAVSSIPDPAAPAMARFPRLTALSAVAAYLLILSGALVTATPGALAACPDWPLCQGWSLPLAHLPAVNMFHRIVAALAGLLLIYTLHLGFRNGGQESGGGLTRSLCLTGVIVLVAQLLVGGIAVWTNFPVELRALHIALATAVWAIMAALALLHWRPLTTANNARAIPAAAD